VSGKLGYSQAIKNSYIWPKANKHGIQLLYRNKEQSCIIIRNSSVRHLSFSLLPTGNCITVNEICAQNGSFSEALLWLQVFYNTRISLTAQSYAYHIRYTNKDRVPLLIWHGNSITHQFLWNLWPWMVPQLHPLAVFQKVSSHHLQASCLHSAPNI